MVVEQRSIFLHKVVPKELLELFVRSFHIGGACCIVLPLLVQELVDEVPEAAPVASCFHENKGA